MLQSRSREGTIVRQMLGNTHRLLTTVKAPAYVCRYPESKPIVTNPITGSFPVLNHGDVVITSNIVAPAKEWRLQSEVLARHSSWFSRSFQEPTPEEQYNRPPWFSYTLELVHGVAELVRQPVNGEIPTPKAMDKSVTKVGNTEGLDLPSGGSAFDAACMETSPLAIIDTYNQILGVFYNIPPLISPEKINEALLQAEQLIKHASTLHCLHLIRSHVGNALLQHRQSLFLAIAADPARWLILASALQNDSIYTESLTHIIGAHPAWPWPTKRSTLPASTCHLIARKSARLETLCLEAEHALLLLTINVGPRPVAPQHDSVFATWFVVATFRDILAREFRALELEQRDAPLRRGTMFRKIARGGSAYMDYAEMERLIRKVMPCALDSLEEDLGLLKQFSKRYVAELARNELMIDGEAAGLGYLTCARVGREDIPWRAAGVGEGVVG